MNPLNFDEQVLQSELPVQVDYWAEWCAPSTIASSMRSFAAFSLNA